MYTYTYHYIYIHTYIYIYTYTYTYIMLHGGGRGLEEGRGAAERVAGQQPSHVCMYVCMYK